MTPLLQDITGFKKGTVVEVLLVYGVAIPISNVIGGKVTNRKPIDTLFYMFIVQAIVLFILSFTPPFLDGVIPFYERTKIKGGDGYYVEIQIKSKFNV